jgi:predicted metalloenzyme YecM
LTQISAKLHDWIFNVDKLPVPVENLNLYPDEMWETITTGDESRPFAELASRIVTFAISEAEVERTISVQRDILGNKANQTSERMLTARTQLQARWCP